MRLEKKNVCRKEIFFAIDFIQFQLNRLQHNDENQPHIPDQIYFDDQFSAVAEVKKLHAVM